MSTLDMRCPCGLQKGYASCCGLFIEGGELPKTAEQLMRSRYTAYSMANIDYIEATMRGPAAKGFDKKQAQAWALAVTWQGLVVNDSFVKGDNATVSFVASFVQDGVAQQIKECSVFERIDNKWYYVDRIAPKKLGRNELCSCGSGKKFKKCCAIPLAIQDAKFRRVVFWFRWRRA